MSEQTIIDVIIPACNEEDGIQKVLDAIPRDLAREIIVCDNGSTDLTAERAREAGATVVDQPLPGYGNACQAGIDFIRRRGIARQPDIVVFLDGDYSDYPEQMTEVIAPIKGGEADFVIGSRVLGRAERGSLTIPQKVGNALATILIRLIYRYRYTDLGPFRAITWEALEQLKMSDPTYGWTVEMQVKVARKKLRFREVPVDYRPRIGKSKVSGTIKGSILAGYKILWTIFRLI
jgi:glycosyltransferase involved in cell wall biosynthesis